MTGPIADVIDHLVSIAPGSPLDVSRRRRPQTRDNAQSSYVALFEPEPGATVAPTERFAIAAFVAGLHGASPAADYYAAGLVERAGTGVAQAIAGEIAHGLASGPYGHYPAGKLSAEDKPGPVHHVAEPNRQALGARLSAALEHAHMLVFHPRDASAAALQAMLDAGWSTTEIVTISQLVAFLSFQLRVVTGLGVLAHAQPS